MKNCMNNELDIYHQIRKMPYKGRRVGYRIINENVYVTGGEKNERM